MRQRDHRRCTGTIATIFCSLRHLTAHKGVETFGPQPLEPQGGAWQPPNVGWWKRQIIPVKVWATMPHGALFTLLFKGVCSLIRPRKQARWWEPMEKNTLSINCAGLIPQSGASGCGNGVRSVCCGAVIAFTAQGRRTDYIQSREPQAPHWPIVHRWTIYSIFGLATKKQGSMERVLGGRVCWQCFVQKCV